MVCQLREIIIALGRDPAIMESKTLKYALPAISNKVRDIVDVVTFFQFMPTTYEPIFALQPYLQNLKVRKNPLLSVFSGVCMAPALARPRQFAHFASAVQVAVIRNALHASHQDVVSESMICSVQYETSDEQENFNKSLEREPRARKTSAPVVSMVCCVPFPDQTVTISSLKGLAVSGLRHPCFASKRPPFSSIRRSAHRRLSLSFHSCEQELKPQGSKGSPATPRRHEPLERCAAVVACFALQ